MRIRITVENLIMLWKEESFLDRRFPSLIPTFIIHILKHLIVYSRHREGKYKDQYYNFYIEVIIQ